MTERYWLIRNKAHLICSRISPLTGRPCGMIHEFLTVNDIPTSVPECMTTEFLRVARATMKDLVEPSGTVHEMDHDSLCKWAKVTA